MVDLVRAEARAIDRDLPIYSIQTMEAVKSDSVAQRRFVLVLVGALRRAGADAGRDRRLRRDVAARQRADAGSRACASRSARIRRDVLPMLVGQALRLALVGVAIGVALSLVLMPLLGSQLYAVRPRDPLTLAGVPLALHRRRDARRADSGAEGDARGSGAGAAIRVGLGRFALGAGLASRARADAGSATKSASREAERAEPRCNQRDQSRAVRPSEATAAQRRERKRVGARIEPSAELRLPGASPDHRAASTRRARCRAG